MKRKKIKLPLFSNGVILWPTFTFVFGEISHGWNWKSVKPLGKTVWYYLIKLKFMASITNNSVPMIMLKEISHIYQKIWVRMFIALLCKLTKKFPVNRESWISYSIFKLNEYNKKQQHGCLQNRILIKQ